MGSTGAGGSILLGLLKGLQLRKQNKLDKMRMDTEKQKALAYKLQALAQQASADTARMRENRISDTFGATNLVDRASALANLLKTVPGANISGGFRQGILTGDTTGIPSGAEVDKEVANINKEKTINAQKIRERMQKEKIISDKELENLKLKNKVKFENYKNSITQKGITPAVSDFRARIDSFLTDIFKSHDKLIANGEMDREKKYDLNADEVGAIMNKMEMLAYMTGMTKQERLREFQNVHKAFIDNVAKTYGKPVEPNPIDKTMAEILNGSNSKK